VGYYDRMATDSGVESIMVKGTVKAMSDACAKGQGENMVSEMIDYFAGEFKK
jgi:2-hydroxy-3-oxopropionate reductase